MARIDYLHRNGAAQVTSDAGQAELLATPTGTLRDGSNYYLFMEKLTISIYKAAAGGGGVIIIKDREGTEIWRVDADSTKDVPVDFGKEGLYIGQDTGLMAVSAGASTSQAEAWIGFKGHLSNKILKESNVWR